MPQQREFPGSSVPDFAGISLAVRLAMDSTSSASTAPSYDLFIRLLVPVGRSGLAIAAGYLGLLSFLLLPGPFAVVCGILAIYDIKRNPHKHGMGRAIFAIVCGLGATVILMVLVALALFGR